MCGAEREKNQLHLCRRIGSQAESTVHCVSNINIAVIIFYCFECEDIRRSTLHIGKHIYIHIILERNILNSEKKSVSVATTKHTLVDDHV